MSRLKNFADRPTRTRRTQSAFPLSRARVFIGLHLSGTLYSIRLDDTMRCQYTMRCQSFANPVPERRSGCAGSCLWGVRLFVVNSHTVLEIMAVSPVPRANRIDSPEIPCLLARDSPSSILIHHSSQPDHGVPVVAALSLHCHRCCDRDLY
ncbi:hypothetical protein C8F01DRAFT_1151515 [Mycena amicta]|nr:hypothetical protein C8F01DRAFT_1151515 [Mycena amicta]